MKTLSLVNNVTTLALVTESPHIKTYLQKGMVCN